MSMWTFLCVCLVCGFIAGASLAYGAQREFDRDRAVREAVRKELQ